MPTGEELFKAEARLESSGFQFFATLQHHLDERFATCFDLTRRVTEYVTQQGQAVTLTDLYHRFTGRATPSLPVGAGVLTHVSAAAPSDPLALNLRRHHSLGRGCLSMPLPVGPPGSPAQAIFYPHAHEPLTPMAAHGRRTRKHPFPLATS